MKDDIKRAWILRILAGGTAGTILLFFLGGVFNAVSADQLVYLPGSTLPFLPLSASLEALTGSAVLAALLQYGLYFALGAGAGVATLPFAEDGAELLVRSALHFGYTAAVSSALLWLSGWNRGSVGLWLAELGLLALLYVLIWFGRWLSWWFELDAIRERLGLTPPPSPLKIRESLPHLGFAAVLSLVVPALLLGLLHLFQAPSLEDPTVWALFLVTPLAALGSLVPGISLGKRQGFCPLYPLAVCLLLLLSTALMYQAGPLSFLCALIAGVCALAGSLLGTARRRQHRAAGPARSQPERRGLQ